MNRRQFLGAHFAGLIAALALPFERFAEWCREWLGTAAQRDQLTIGVLETLNFDVGMVVTRNGEGSYTISSVDRVRGTITFDMVPA